MLRVAPSNGRILIVDDEKTNCDVIYSFLMLLNFPNRESRTTFAYNGDQAVKEIRRSLE